MPDPNLNQNPSLKDDEGRVPPLRPGGGGGGNSGGGGNNTAEETVTDDGNGGVTYSWAEGMGDNSGGAFDYLYNLTTGYPNTIKSLVHTEGDNKIYSTNISLYNPYYVKAGNKPGNKTPDGKSGHSTAIWIDKSRRLGMWAGRSNYSGQIAAKLDKEYDGHQIRVVLPNCVGFVNARSHEVWNLALKSGYLQKQGDKYVIPSKGNKEVHKFYGVPACDAYGFRLWSRYNNGSPETTGYYKSNSPVPGAIICWRASDEDGYPGHVGFVEAVYNPGSPDEYCITSESGYSAGGVSKLVWTGKRTRKSNYKYNSFPFVSFLCSPVCELASFGGKTVTVGDPVHPTEEEEEAIEEARAEFSGQTILADLKVNTKVEIQWFGNERPNNTGKRINKLGAIAKIIAKDQTQVCPYTLSFDGKTVLGYYKRTAIKPVDGDNAINENPENWWI